MVFHSPYSWSSPACSSFSNCPRRTVASEDDDDDDIYEDDAWSNFHRSSYSVPIVVSLFSHGVVVIPMILDGLDDEITTIINAGPPLSPHPNHHLRKFLLLHAHSCDYVIGREMVVVVKREKRV